MNFRKSTGIFTSIFMGVLLVLVLWPLLSNSVGAMPAISETINPSASSVPDVTHHPVMSLNGTSSYTLSLPIVLKPHGSLYGYVTENGIPVPGITVTLEFCRSYDFAINNTLYCSDRLPFHTTTDANGWYGFIDMPTLVISGNAGLTQTYQIFWQSLDPNRLSGWQSRILDRYSVGDQVNLSNFDVGGIGLLSPISGTVTGFPVTFYWTPRVAVPSDNYAFCLVGGFIPPPPFRWDIIGCDQPLGYIDHFMLSDPFNGIDYGYNYYWTVVVYGPDGGQSDAFPFFVDDYHSNRIIFSNP